MKSKIPNIIKNIETPVSNAIRQGRRNKYNQVVGAMQKIHTLITNVLYDNVLKVVQARRLTICKKKEIKMMKILIL